MALGAAIQVIAHVMVSKFDDHLPFYRQAEIYVRRGIRLDQATLGNWVGSACFHLRPVVDHLRERLKSADRVFMAFGGTVAPGAPRESEDPQAPLLDLGRRKTNSSDQQSFRGTNCREDGTFWALGIFGQSSPMIGDTAAPTRRS